MTAPCLQFQLTVKLLLIQYDRFNLNHHPKWLGIEFNPLIELELLSLSKLTWALQGPQAGKDPT